MGNGTDALSQRLWATLGSTGEFVTSQPGWTQCSSEVGQGVGSSSKEWHVGSLISGVCASLQSPCGAE